MGPLRWGFRKDTDYLLVSFKEYAWWRGTAVSLLVYLSVRFDPRNVAAVPTLVWYWFVREQIAWRLSEGLLISVIDLSAVRVSCNQLSVASYSCWFLLWRECVLMVVMCLMNWANICGRFHLPLVSGKRTSVISHFSWLSAVVANVPLVEEHTASLLQPAPSFVFYVLLSEYVLDTCLMVRAYTLKWIKNTDTVFGDSVNPS
jgi:hypothetical protein